MTFSKRPYPQSMVNYESNGTLLTKICESYPSKIGGMKESKSKDSLKMPHNKKSGPTTPIKAFKIEG